jgi:hypothetical protein
MQPDEPQLRDGLEVVAAQAGPLRLDAAPVVRRVRRRRRRRALVGATAGTAIAVLAVTAIVGSLGGAPRPERAVGGDASVDPSMAVTSPVASPVPDSPVFMCGRRLELPDAASTRSALTMTVGSARYRSEEVGPMLSVTFTASAATHVTSSPPGLFQVLYLRDGLIVGGGPMLNGPGDTQPQGIDAVGYGFEVGPGHPAQLDLGARDRLCPSLTWHQIWSEPEAYEVVVLQGPVQGGSGQLSIGIPALSGPLLTGRARLSR